MHLKFIPLDDTVAYPRFPFHLCAAPTVCKARVSEQVSFPCHAQVQFSIMGTTFMTFVPQFHAHGSLSCRQGAKF